MDAAACKLPTPRIIQKSVNDHRNAALLTVCRELRLKSSIQLLVEDGNTDTRVLCDKVVDLSTDELEFGEELWRRLRENYGGKLLSRVELWDPEEEEDEDHLESEMEVHWVTEPSEFNSVEASYREAFGNEPGGGFAYLNLCLIVELGEAGKRETAA